MIDRHALLVDEQALYEQEQGLLEMEAQLHTQEQGLSQMERAFQAKNKALVHLASYVREQEQSLLRRAEAIGHRVYELAHELLEDRGESARLSDLDLGRLPERLAALQKRRDLINLRLQLTEQREQLYTLRLEELERAEHAVAGIEALLAKREAQVSNAARKVFEASVALTDDDEEDVMVPLQGHRSQGFSNPLAREKTRPTGEAPNPTRTTFAQHSSADHPSLKQIEVPLVADMPRVEAPAQEEKVLRRRSNARARVRTNQFKITLEAQLDSSEAHHFFRYEDDTPEDLPGLFIATPNLLKVSREVRIRVGNAGRLLEATGIVAWRRQRGEAGGPPGMGIELLNLSDTERNLIADWTKMRAPVTL